MRWILALLLLCRAAQAQPPCAPAWEGLELCIAERLCRCRFVPGGSLDGRPPGFRWDCGILRPACGVAPAEPPPVFLPPIGYPSTPQRRGLSPAWNQQIME